jgi:formylglycine-generating enzyme required for sulfatase activity
LAKIDAPQGMIVAYATQAGQTSYDGDGRNSPFTTAFLKHIEEQDEIGNIFREVSEDVYETTNHSQLPELYLSIIGRFYLRGKIEVSVKPEVKATPAPSVQVDPCAAAADHWHSAEVIGTIDALQDHLKRFPNCAFAGLAQAKIDVLKKMKEAESPTASNKIVPESKIVPSLTVNPETLQAVKPPPTLAETPTVSKPPEGAKPEQNTAVAMVAPAQPSPTMSGECSRDQVNVSLSSRAPCPLSVAEERSVKPKDVFKECDKCPEMVVVPAGKFTMGSHKDEKDRYDNEGPQHDVTINRPFAVGKFHVTVDQFAAFVAATSYNDAYALDKWLNRNDAWHGKNASRPAVGVSWDDAKAYVSWVAKKTGKSYRLLSEAEWEYAARAGTKTRYYFGENDKDLCRYGNGVGECDGYKSIAPVGSFAPNAFGLYDMHGNAWQWVEDCYHENYSGAPTDGSALTFGDCGRRVLRGGSWNNDSRDLRAASRDGGIPGSRGGNDGGFRLGRTLTP